MRTAPLAVALALSFPSFAQQPPAPRFSVSPDERGAWSFVTPEGHRLVSLGVNNVGGRAWNPRPNSRFYNAVEDQFKGDAAAWAASTRRILLDAGFNTLGAWGKPEMPAGDGLYQTIILYVGGAEPDRCLNPIRPGFEELVRKNTREMMAQYRGREWLLGVFLDNEMPWYGKTAWDRLATFTLLERAFQEKPTDPARLAALDFLKARHATPAALGEAYGQPLASWEELTKEYLQTCTTPTAAADRAEFTAMVARRFYAPAARIVREELPGVLILGTRFAGDAPDAVIAACGEACDVVSFNAYVGAPAAPAELIARYWTITKKPLMLTEFSWRARENTSGNPNSRGAGTVVMTQAQRAANYQAFITDLLAEPVIVGAHWFEFADQSPQGRFDGEDSNYGIVDIEHRPYTELLAAMRQTNLGADKLRAGPLKPVPTEVPKPRAVAYDPGQHPDRPPTVDLLAAATRPPETWTAPDASVTLRPGDPGVAVDFDLGSQWGVGFNLFGPAASRLGRGPDESTDLDGYNDLVLELDAPKGLQINITLHEASSGAPGQGSYATGAGDDGESYISPPAFGTGATMTLRVPIRSMLPLAHWGNQAGARRIDMNALRTVGLQLQGAPQRGTLRVLAFRLEK